MNGDLGIIYDRLTKVETIQTERWAAHEKRAKDLGDHIDTRFDELKDSILASLPCKAKSQECNDKFNRIWAIIIVILIAIVGSYFV